MHAYMYLYIDLSFFCHDFASTGNKHGRQAYSIKFSQSPVSIHCYALFVKLVLVSLFFGCQIIVENFLLFHTRSVITINEQ